MKKNWENASVEELVIEATAHGGKTKAEHDGVWMTDANGDQWEATWPASH